MSSHDQAKPVQTQRRAKGGSALPRLPRSLPQADSVRRILRQPQSDAVLDPARRQRLIADFRRYFRNVLSGIQSGWIWPRIELPIRNHRISTQGFPQPFPFPTTSSLNEGVALPGSMGSDTAMRRIRVETWQARNQRLRQFVIDLRQLLIELESGTYRDWTAQPAGPVCRNLAASETTKAYLCWMEARRPAEVGNSPDPFFDNTMYGAAPPSQPNRLSIEQRPTPFRSGVATGVHLFVRDPERAPLNYSRISGTTSMTGPGALVEVWRDGLGPYYLYRGQRFDLPEDY